MAQVLFGNGISDMRGSLAGDVYSRVRSGAIVRNRTKPINPNTARQANVRARFAQTMSSYKLLSLGQIQSWESFAQTVVRQNSLGQDYTPQASQIYQEINLNLNVIGQPEADEPPIDKPDHPTITGITLNGEYTTGIVTLLTMQGIDVPEDGYFVIEATLPHPASRRNNLKYFRQISVVEVDPGVISILFAYDQTFAAGSGVPYSENQVISVRTRVVGLNGLSSTWVYEDVVLSEA